MRSDWRDKIWPYILFFTNFTHSSGYCCIQIWFVSIPLHWWYHRLCGHVHLSSRRFIRFVSHTTLSHSDKIHPQCSAIYQHQIQFNIQSSVHAQATSLLISLNFCMFYILPVCLFQNDENFSLLNFAESPFDEQNTKVLPDASIKTVIVQFVCWLQFIEIAWIHRIKKKVCHRISFDLTIPIWWSLSRTDYEITNDLKPFISIADHWTYCTLFGNTFYRSFIGCSCLFTQCMSLCLHIYYPARWSNGWINLSIHWEHCNPSKHFQNVQLWR